MITKKDMRRITPYLWEIPAEFRYDMKVPCRIFASDRMMDDIIKDRSLEQLVNVATLPGIIRAAYVMPDVHEGYGFPIGGVAATSYPDGVISPGGIGYDINCGVRLLKSEHSYAELEPYIKKLGEQMYFAIPSGVGKSGFLRLSMDQMNNVLSRGVPWVMKNGYGTKSDIEYTESNGCLKNADPDAVSQQAKARGIDQLGTLGSGNHFVEIDCVEQIFDAAAANAYGLFAGQVVMLIHTGSRGLGHQVASDYIKIFLQSMNKFGIFVPDRELACAPMDSREGRSYFNAMSGAANFAWCNRQVITHLVRNVWEKVLGSSAGELSLLYDVAHNIAKIEEYADADGNLQQLIIHRKGATRAFGPDNQEIPLAYRAYGQPVIIPGSMGTASFVLAGTRENMVQTFGSCCHGAGRQMSRHEAKRMISGEQLLRDLAQKGIIIQSDSMPGLAEEAPAAYKDIDDVVNVVSAAGIARKVAQLRPVMVIKG